MDRRTTPLGVPTWVVTIEGLRQDLREHIEHDDRRLASLTEATNDLNVETGKQTVMLARIESALERRAKVEDFEARTAIKVSGARRSAFWRGIIGTAFALAAAAVGALIHHLAT